MSTILDILGVVSASAAFQLRSTPGEFNENARRTELIRGIAIQKVSKSLLRSALAKRLYDLITKMLPAGFVIRREDPLTLADSEPEPDVAVMRSEAEFFSKHPSTADLVT